MGEYEVTLDGGGPWGMRLQGGKDFGVALNIARVNPGSKAENHGLVAGDQILAINGNLTENLTHNQAQNLIKGAGSRLSLKLKQGKGVSLGEIKQVGSGGFAAQPKQTIYQTETTHSAGVDHKFNAKPKAFGAANVGATTITARASAPSNVAVGKKFDPAEYARKKKEELEKYKEEKNNPKEIEEQSEVLKMLQNTSVDSNKGSGAGSFSRLQNQLDNEDETNGAAPPPPDVAFRMTAESSDLYDVSPGSKKVMDDIRNRGTSGLSNQGASTGSRSFKLLQQMTDDADDLPPPPPDMFEQEQEAPKNSGTFNSMQQQIDAGQGDQIKTVFSQPSGQRGQPVYAGAPVKKFNPPSYVSPTPKAPASSGPNFRVGRASAPTFKPSPISNQGNQRVAPPAVNAGEVQNPNSRMLGGGGNFSPPPTSPSYQPSMSPNQFNRPAASPTNQFNQPAATSPTNKYNRRPSDHTFQPNANNRGAPSYPTNPPQQQQQQQGSQPAGRFSPPSSNPPSNMNQRVMNHSQPQPAPSPTSQKDLNCFACNQLLTGPFVSAIGKTWHPEHFCCSACNVSLQNQAFVEENNSLFCEKCYNHYYAPKCAHCNNAIIGTASNDVICDECLAANTGVFDPLQCSLSVNWLVQQLHETNTVYESSSREVRLNKIRIAQARQKINDINARRQELETRIEKTDKQTVATERKLQHKMKLLAATTNLLSGNEKTHERLAKIQYRLDFAQENSLATQLRLTEQMTVYRAKLQRLDVTCKRTAKLESHANVLSADLQELEDRIAHLKSQPRRKDTVDVFAEKQVQYLESAIDEAETQAMFAEQTAVSLALYKETLETELRTQQVENLNARDKIELLKRKKRTRMRELNISHPSQIMLRR